VCYDEFIKSGAASCSGRIITRSSLGRYELKLAEWVTLSTCGVSGKSFKTSPGGYPYSVPYPLFKKLVLMDLGGYDNSLE
jgi:hypothetical protein